MAEFAYTPNAAGIRKFLAHIQQASVPSKVTHTYLKGAGFKSSNDRYLIAVLKFIGFLDSSGVPTEPWRRYRSKDAGPAVMAAALRSAYSDLFGVYPDAYRKDDEALLDYFSSHTTLAKATLARVVGTFKALCANAAFEAPSDAGMAPSEVIVQPSPRSATAPAAAAPAPSVTITIQLQLPATEDASVYDNLFAAMKRHLFS